MIINYLSWDTEFFGFKTGKIEILDENDFDPMGFIEQALDEKYELIYVFKYGAMLTWQTISKASIELVDIMLTMSKKFDKKDYVDIPYEFRRELSMDELEDCYYIAEETSIVSRFSTKIISELRKPKSVIGNGLIMPLIRPFQMGNF